MSKYEEFIDKMQENNLSKGAVIDVLNIYVNGGSFLKHLEDFISKDGERHDYHGVIYSDEYEQDDEGYFGENKVLFYSGDEDDACDIVNYDELYEYLKVSCEFYSFKHPEQTNKVHHYLSKIKEKYNIKN
ncbi:MULTISPECIES: ribonuclease toxin immunity protein CdiI [Bacillus]|uniref:CDI immunity protein domain-containing protein n=1 Tax=Bacillus glycinifermentans TaxID=1664069 RepID=A0AAJ4D2L6_9BACI|nr:MULTISPECIES: ribonuclease toxin immunity protein CdiI [Bacillus]KKB71775.1 hypothetical protein TH62_21665 [Bacillus sp. TH008]MDU0072828.1 ribonuclease toxin immunity protein CdiI [Bacillus sp. IG6]MED8020621.1 ribonuclease toxin immunity protein CdiI [Bacillus glycinifermentans]QAT65623.1 hypothetical protein EQZ20_12405 [Bacillus glycinifermentans]WKB75319.1 ribonuclease toxin immunity protein CdiI [Bacillus glycinifermentans]